MALLACQRAKAIFYFTQNSVSEVYLGVGIQRPYVASGTLIKYYSQDVSQHCSENSSAGTETSTPQVAPSSRKWECFWLLVKAEVPQQTAHLLNCVGASMTPFLISSRVSCPQEQDGSHSDFCALIL